MPRAIKKQFSQAEHEFIGYLEKHIPPYRMPAIKFYKDFNNALRKSISQKIGFAFSSIIEIEDLDTLRQFLGVLTDNSLVYIKKSQEPKAVEGLKYYMDFLQERSLQPQAPQTEVSVTEEDMDSQTEGIMKERQFFMRKRNRTIRNECAKRSGYRCYVCGMDFETVYGPRGHEYIEIHHKKPLASYDGEHEILIDDLCALCSNCHSMVHHGKELMDVDTLKELYLVHKHNRGSF